jgi:hypothetical protein
MSGIDFYLFVLFLAGVLLWQILTGRALGTWRRPSLTRQANPGAYWFVLAIQGAILIVFLLTGKSWHLR